MQMQREDRQNLSTVALSEAFARDSDIFLRSSPMGIDIMTPVRCLSTHLESSVITVQVADNPKARSVTPQPGEAVILNNLLRGILYIAKGTVLDLSSGKVRRIRIKSSKVATAIRLRQHPRYLIHGKIKMGEPDQKMSVIVESELNISQGGFGFSLPVENWDGGNEIKFELDLLSAAHNSAQEHSLSLNLSGRGIIRKRGELPGKPGEEYFGIQFDALSLDQQRELEMWIATVATSLRQL